MFVFFLGGGGGGWMSSRGVRRAGIPGGGPSREGRGRRFYDYKRTYDDGCRYLFWKVKAVDSMVGMFVTNGRDRMHLVASKRWIL